jgi:integrase
MGFSRKRVGLDGRPRYTAYYVDGWARERSAGTFGTRRDADRAWRAIEVALASGRPNDPHRGRMTFKDYVEKTWFPNHVLEPSTRQSYHYVIHRHLLPAFGPVRMGEILPAHVREWVTAMVAAGQSPANIRHSKIVLSAIFTTALNDLVIGLHPCKGVKSPTVPVKEYRILTPEEFDKLYDEIPTPVAQLLVSTLIDSGMRWGEVTELRLRDLHQSSRIVTIARSVVEVDSKFHPDGERFAVKPYPKGRRSRRFKLSPTLVRELAAHAQSRGLGPDDLLFRFDYFLEPSTIAEPLRSVDALGLTEPNVAGRTYRHGTLSAYTAGKCRCVHCRRAFAEYRAARRNEGLDDPRSPRLRDTDGHLSGQWFRTTVWKPACEAAGIDPPVRLHDLRHSHASWLLAGGASLTVVKERLGHVSIATTDKYLHTLPDADDTALAALDRVRSRGRSDAV